MRKIAIIADDLTGALDAAAPFAARGLKTVAVVDDSQFSETQARGADVLAINTASREISAAEARARVARVLSRLPADCILFKKVDSRLKGPIAEELSAFAGRSLLVVPAIPDFGRVVRDGKVTGFGVDTPLDVAGRIGAAVGKARIPDIATQVDMDRVIAACAPGTVIVGARGAALALAKRMGPAAGATPRGLGRRLVMLIGSRDPITLAQIRRLVQLVPGVVLDQAPSGVTSAAPGMAAEAPAAVVQAVPGPGAPDADTVARALAASYRSRYAAPRDGLLLCGGATAQTVLGELGITSLDVRGEIIDGVPACISGGITILTKSGGFGEEDALVEVLSRYQVTGRQEQKV